MSARVFGEGTPVLLVHGIPGSGRSWDKVVPLLAEKCRVVVPDLIGFGESSRSVSIDDLWVERQATLLETIALEGGASKPIVLAHDYGGPVALTLLARNPEFASRLILASTNTFGDTPIPFPLSGIFLPAVGKLWASMLFSAPSLRMMVRAGSKFRGDAGTGVGDASQARAIRTIFESALRELRERYLPIQESLSRIRVPTSVVWGDADPFFPVEQGKRTADAIPGAKLVVLPQAGHFLPEECPAELTKAVVECARVRS